MIDDVGSQRRTLKELLQERGLNQSRLAKALNIRRQTINVWINEGVVPTQPPSVYLKMCRLLNVTLEELVEILEGDVPFPADDAPQEEP